MKTTGLSLDQAPPLSIPSSFFLTIPIGIFTAGYFMLTAVAAALGSPWTAQTIALTHTATLGILAMGMLGALYQMTPVIAGTPVPFVRLAHIVHASLLAGLILPLATLFTHVGINDSMSQGQLAAIAALPAAVVIWLAHPTLILHGISRRRRKRSDASLLFWKTGLGIALLLIPAAIVALFLPDPRWQVLFGWLAIWGWAGLIMHGMLSRIVPFLVWFHRYSARVGLEPVPSMRSLLSQRRILVGFALHSCSVLLGAATILIQADILAQLTGMLLIATAISLGSNLIHVLRQN